VADISIEQLELMFENMTRKAGWAATGNLLWGYFFTDSKSKKLEPLATHLIKLGYHFVSIYETDDRSTNFLHVERVEAHTPSSLLKLNAEMNALALQFGVYSYDGMDASHVP
jgi:Regulator of ribonuclease activity B